MAIKYLRIDIYMNMSFMNLIVQTKAGNEVQFAWMNA